MALYSKIERPDGALMVSERSRVRIPTSALVIGCALEALDAVKGANAGSGDARAPALVRILARPDCGARSASGVPALAIAGAGHAASERAASRAD